MEDALHAARAAVEEGILPGGGISMLKVLPVLDKVRPSATKRSVSTSCAGPWSRHQAIAANAGPDGSIVAQKVMENPDRNFGYDAMRKEYGDMIKFGVIVPTKVGRTALQNAHRLHHCCSPTDAVVRDP